MIGFVLFSFKRAWQGFWRNAVMSLAATATMVLMLLLLAGFWIIQTGLLAGLQFTEKKVEVVAYLQPNTTDTQVSDLETKLRGMPQVASVTYVSRDQALATFRASMAAQGREDLTRYLDANPLYASLEVKMVDPSQVRVVGDALRADPSIRNVINIEDLVERVLTVTSILRTAGTVVLVIVGVIALFIIINTIRLAVLARADEIEVMRLVGASDAFIRWPFVFEGAFVGFLGAALTLADPARRGRPAQRVHGRLLPRPAAPVRLADARPGRAGDGRRCRARDPRLLALGADLPHPLAPRVPGGPGLRPSGSSPALARNALYPIRRNPRDATPQDGSSDASSRPRPTLTRPSGEHRPASLRPRCRPRRGPPPPAPRPRRRRRVPVVQIAIVIVAVLAGSALFLSGYSMGRRTASDPGHAGIRGHGLPAVLGHVPHHRGSVRR